MRKISIEFDNAYRLVVFVVFKNIIFGNYFLSYLCFIFCIGVLFGVLYLLFSQYYIMHQSSKCGIIKLIAPCLYRTMGKNGWYGIVEVRITN